jgi:hypothetical protein
VVEAGAKQRQSVMPIRERVRGLVSLLGRHLGTVGSHWHCYLALASISNVVSLTKPRVLKLET